MYVHIHIKVRNITIKHFDFAIIVLDFRYCSVFSTFNFNSFQDAPYGNRDLFSLRHDQSDEFQ